MPDETGPTDTVRRYIDAFNKGDVKTMAALFNESGVHGQQITQTGVTYTVALARFAAGWRIRAWAWAKGAQAGHAPR
jgi:hypothetical protein